MPALGTRVAALGLIALMAVGSLMLWIGVPFAWIYLASQLVETSQPTMGPYVMVLVGIPLSMVLVGKLLTRLNRAYGSLTHTTPVVRVRAPWHKSMRDGRDSGHPRTVLDVVMVISVSIAMTCFGVWFLLFAEGGGI